MTTHLSAGDCRICATWAGFRRDDICGPCRNEPSYSVECPVCLADPDTGCAMRSLGNGTRRMHPQRIAAYRDSLTLPDPYTVEQVALWLDAHSRDSNNHRLVRDGYKTAAAGLRRTLPNAP